MISRHICFVTLLCISQLHGQTTATKTPSSSSSSSDSEGRDFVRRISAGGTLNFLPLSLQTSASTSATLDSGATVTTSASSQSNWFSGGVVVQFAFKDRWAVATNFLIRRPGYQLTTTTTLGSVTTTETEQTRATYWDVPLVARRYSLGRREAGFRWFYEVGGTARFVGSIKTQIETTVTDSTAGTTTTTCCDVAPSVPAHRVVGGVVAGAGLQLIDDYGVHIVPEFRYTRWLQRTFESPAAPSQMNQIEVLVGITF